MFIGHLLYLYYIFQVKGDRPLDSSLLRGAAIPTYLSVGIPGDAHIRGQRGGFSW